MNNVPEDLKYLQSHEWLRDLGDGIVEIGITDHAQELLGDLVFVELPDVGQTVEAGTECTVLESVKAASDVYSPVSGDVVEVNEALSDAPETINNHPYADGWICRIKLSDTDDLNQMLDAAAYTLVLENEAH